MEVKLARFPCTGNGKLAQVGVYPPLFLFVALSPFFQVVFLKWRFPEGMSGTPPISSIGVVGCRELEGPGRGAEDWPGSHGLIPKAKVRILRSSLQLLASANWRGDGGGKFVDDVADLDDLGERLSTDELVLSVCCVAALCKQDSTG